MADVDDVWAKAEAATAGRDALRQSKERLMEAESALDLARKKVEEARQEVNANQRHFDIALESFGELCKGIPPILDD
jgi:hypothetical protein